MPRQCPDRYAIRAGRNLPDKEFRYLRTVIVTAAVHWGFNSNLRIPTCVYLALLLTFQHWAGVSPYTSSFDLAETCVFGKQSPGPIHCDPITLITARVNHASRVPLLPKLRGYFAEFLSKSYLAHLGILCQPTCGGLRYGHPNISLAKLFLAVWRQHLRVRRPSSSRLSL